MLQKLYSGPNKFQVVHLVMSYYQSNYPSYGGGGGYGGYGGYSGSGPPPPPQGYGGYGGYGNSYSAYNVNQSAYSGYQMGSAPPPQTGGYGGGGYGANPYQAIQGCYQQYQNNPQYQQQTWQPPPPPPAPQGMVDQYNQQMYQNQWYAQQQMKERISQEMGIKRKKGKKKKQRKVEEDDTEEEEEEDNEEETDPKVEAMLKEKLRSVYIDELMRRLKVSGTLDITEGTIGFYHTYGPTDPVLEFMATKDEDLTKKKWNAEYDVQYLRSAMRGLGTNEDAITHVITTRNNAQRQDLKKKYKTSYGRDLIEDIESELSGDYRSAVMALFVPPAVYDAYCIKEAIYGPGTDEASLIEILMTRTNPQINELRKVYGDVASPHRKASDALIEKDIEGDTSGDFKRLLVAASQGDRYEITREQLEEAVEEITVEGNGTGMYNVNYSKLADMGQAKRDAEKLFKAGEDRWGTDEEEFIRIFSTRHYYQLRATWNEYVKLTQRDITNSVDRETSGDFRSGLKAIAQNIKCRPKYFAERLKKAIKGLGTDDKTLIRIVVSRAEIDMVQIKKEFLEMNKQTLWKWIQDDTSGDYRKLLCAIVGKN